MRRALVAHQVEGKLFIALFQIVRVVRVLSGVSDQARHPN